MRADFFVTAVAPLREDDGPFARPWAGKDRHFKSAIIGSPLDVPVAGSLTILEQECGIIAAYAHIWLTPLLLAECPMRNNENDQIRRLGLWNDIR